MATGDPPTLREIVERRNRHGGQQPPALLVADIDALLALVKAGRPIWRYALTVMRQRRAGRIHVPRRDGRFDAFTAEDVEDLLDRTQE